MIKKADFVKQVEELHKSLETIPFPLAPAWQKVRNKLAATLRIIKTECDEVKPPESTPKPTEPAAKP